MDVYGLTFARGMAVRDASMAVGFAKVSTREKMSKIQQGFIIN